MDPQHRKGIWLAPGAPAGASALRAPGRTDALPAVDDNLVGEDERAEIIDGQRVETAPAEEPHAVEHFGLPAVIGRCLSPGYRGAVDMLTRTDARTNFAPDVSVYPAERDPATGGRQLEELAFEVIDTTRLAEVTDKARRLTARGVRRVFVLDVNAETVREWSPAAGQWVLLPDDAVIEDRCFATPLPVRALRDDLLADEVAFRAMQARGVPAVVSALVARELRGRAEGVAVGRAEGVAVGRAEGVAVGRAEGVAVGRAEGVAVGRAEGVAEGALRARREMLLETLSDRGLAVTADQHAQIEACTDEPTLRHWTSLARTAVTTDEALA